ncbi:MAG: hypothetical protein D6B27_06710 [Gammaproteobacteria bacterium]|nr:MAG: hypothetical protein D6B27_06710 [Gammaproteobacteria bacterium]
MKIKNALLATAVAAVISPLSAFAQCDQYTSSLDEHVANDRAVAQSFFYTKMYKAKGSLETLGYIGSSVATLNTTDGGDNFQKGECPEETNHAPEIIEYTYTKTVKDYQLVVTGKATDVDGNLSSVGVGNAAFGWNCPGLYLEPNVFSFECVVDVPNLQVDVLNEWYLVAFDAEDKMSEHNEVFFTVIDPTVNHAPEIVSYEYNAVVTDGILTVTGSADDVDGNLDKVIVGNPATPGIECTPIIPTSFECSVDVSGMEKDVEHEWAIAALDTEGVISELKDVKFTVVAEDVNTCVRASNQSHADAGRAISYGTSFFAKGSFQYLGANGVVLTTLEETQENYWVVSDCEAPM